MARSQIASSGDSWYQSSAGGSATTILLPSRTITAGSLVVIGWRYDGAAAFSSITGGGTGGAPWSATEYNNGTNTVGIAYLYNHAGGSISAQVNLSASRTYRSICGVEFGGDASFNPLDGTVASASSWSQTKTAAGAGTAVMVCASDGGTPTAGTGTLQRGEAYFGIVTQGVTTGSNTITPGGTPSIPGSVLAFFLDAAVSGSSSVPPPFPRFNYAILNH